MKRSRDVVGDDPTLKSKHRIFLSHSGSRKEFVGDDPTLNSTHRIFLSHSGFQKEFVEFLCLALESRCRYPFFDKRPSSIPKGERFPEVIVKAVEQCEMLVVVVSDEYFMSKWPMIELHAFVQAIEALKHKPSNSREKFILPLFYGLSVDEFRDKTRRQKWFEQWATLAKDDGQRRVDVNAWKNGLDVLGSYNGIPYDRELQEIKAYEDEIVSQICGKISPSVKWDDSHVQGKSQICEVLFANIRSVGRLERFKCKVVGIFGVGGIGKTTICKTLCNELSNEYEGRVCHVELETPATGSSSVEVFRKAEPLRKVVTLLTNKDPEFVGGLDEGQCKYILRNSVWSPRTFVAVDNVWDNPESRTQAKTILETAKFDEGSLVIVTARSRSTLELLGLDGGACIEMPGLGEADAVKLLLHHAADGKQFAGEGERRDIGRCIERCYFGKVGGTGSYYHPLTLRTLGIQLADVGEKPSVWVKELPRVRNFSDFGGGNPVFDVLRSSFDRLRPIQQRLFMDLVVYCPYDKGNFSFGPRRADLEWLCLVYEKGEDEMMSWLDVLKRKGLLEAWDWTWGGIRVHDLYVEFAVLESEGKLDESRDFKERRWVSVTIGDLTELERTPSGGCWQELSRLRIEGAGGNPRPISPDRGLKGIEWRFFSNVEVLKLEKISFVQESLNLEGLKCLRSLVVHEVYGLDRLEGLEGLKNLTYFQWFFGDYMVEGYFGGGTRIVGQLPVSLRVLVIQGGFWLEPNVFGRCRNLSELHLRGGRAD